MEKIRDDAINAKFKVLVNDLEEPDHRILLRAKNTGSWLTVWGTTVTGTVLAAIYFCDFLCARYDVTPPLTKKIYGCAYSLSVNHRLSYNNGGLFICQGE